MEEVFRKLDEVISCIQDTKEYQMCISLKEKMEENQEIMDLIEKVKLYQKKYIRSGYDLKVKEELNAFEESLNQIPIYVIYLENLSSVNEMIEYVKDSLNDYFDQLFNKKY